MHATKIPIILTLFFVTVHSFTPFSVNISHSISQTVSKQNTSVLFSRKPEEPNPRGMYEYGKPRNSDEEIEAALKDFKQQSQIKAFGVLTVAFSSFVYLKLQYDADPSSFLGSH
mmetsp:Transcript_175/g.261  ORF Transcript_175/g.261 Transcript_175/m.261 type:complete len:114 (+) Transcript_175:101-442(+)